ncbi:hypothetical protein O1611_g5825 [Lasiodiplodia mahajangana]|uniref:Uncharacterized protein n=1 Tax=Lasiodiplodia mahajangana TaxID=1108764 RepID=A0ACC2JK31_9PEZI|nr:hypothetical protein O1611_g5825 [Lasiodiplodia mahajangana]
MPPVQRHLPTETEKGASASPFHFSIRHALESLVEAGRPLLALGSAIRLGRPGNMTKPGNVGAPTPINTLSNNTGTSRTRFGISPTSRSIPSTPPPAKRQKLYESSTSPSHIHAFFAKAETSTPRRLSTGSVSVADSQHSVISNKSVSQRTLDKYHNYATSRGSRRDRSLSRPPRPEEDLTDDEVDLISPQKAPRGPHQPKRKRPEERPISEFSDRFKENVVLRKSDASQHFQNVLDKVDKRIHYKGSDSSPDELALSSEEIPAGRPAKRRRHFSPSLSRRPKATSATSGDTSSHISTMGLERLLALKRDADLIIPNGLRILRGASGQCQYQAEYQGDPDYCSLSIVTIGHTLNPVDQEGNILKPYTYLTLDLKRVRAVLRPKDGDSCRIVIVIFSTLEYFSTSGGQKLFVEFATTEELARFFQWVALYKNEGCSVAIKDCNRAKLEKDLDEMMQRAKSHKIITDAEVKTPVAEDVKLIQHNHSNRAPAFQTDHCVPNAYRAQPKLRDAMKSPTLQPSTDGVISSRSWDDQSAPAQRQPRTTRSTFAYVGSPEPHELMPKGWTSLNAGWEKQWRNSLVYPNAGKNRATIDKDDIQRLDEGQFLNDNIIIFYLRYLQKNLEDSNGDVAKRIYFQNTFFYDKLKPTKSGQGINYDSVKSWTSKVDLFSKDYIIVPINEYAHWYVAIICNAPKLLPSSADHNSTQSGITTVPNDTPSLETPQTSTQIAELDNYPNDERVVSAEEDVVENLRGMSIDSSSHSNEAKQKADNGAEEVSDSIPTKDGHDVYEVKDSDRLESEVEHIATTAHPPIRKKMGKRQSIGPRRYDPNQPRIITLDSLGATHSPTCSFLKQYLIAELRDKKGIVIPSPGAMGTTAKGVPEQTNHCDCGLFLLGYIQEFLRNPDLFIRSLLQRDGEISWHLEPSELRADIRNLIFDLQKKQQEAEDLAQERKRQARLSHYTPSKLELASPDSRDKPNENKSPEAPTNSRPSSTRGRSTTPRETNRGHLPICEMSVESTVTEIRPEPQLSAHGLQGDDSKTTRRSEMGYALDMQEKETRPSDPHVVASPRPVESVFDGEIHNQAANTASASPVQGQAAKYYSLSPETEASTQFQRDFVPPLFSETPSPKGSRGATPLDPVIVDDSDNNERNRPSQSLQRHRGGRTGHQLIVEIPSTNVRRRPPGQDDKIDRRGQTGEQSSYFANRRNGERVTAANLRENPANDVIDLSDD